MCERKSWTTTEDNALKQLYETRGVKKWTQVSKLLAEEFGINKRTGKQCRQRYHNHLDSNIRHEKWTIEEEIHLFKLQSTLGNHWASIARQLQGRSENAVKNQYYSILRRGLRKINQFIRLRFRRQRDLSVKVLYKILEGCEHTEGEDAATGEELKQQLAFFGLNNVLSQDIEPQRIKKIVESLKLLDNCKQKKSKKIICDEESDSIQSEEYLDDFPVQALPLQKTILSSFRQESQEDKSDLSDLQVMKNSKGGLWKYPQIDKEMSLRSMSSFEQPQLELGDSKIFELMGTECQIDMTGDQDGYCSMQMVSDSPYFDRFKKSFSRFRSFERSE